MTVFINEKKAELINGARVCDAVLTASPFGSDPVAVLLNGVPEPPDSTRQLREGDILGIYPLLIGG